MMFSQLLFTLILFSLFFTNILSLQCYAGTDSECMLLPSMNDCGEGETCQCAKYRFKCTQGDEACTESEQLSGVTKWAYIITSKSTCETMKSASYSSIYQDVTCCSENKCNKPAKNVQCSVLQARRRNLRKFSDNLLNFKHKY